MTSLHAFKCSAIGVLLLVGLTGLSGETSAQSSAAGDAAAAEDDRNTGSTIDRGKMRLELLIRLVENEVKEARLRQSRLAVEAAQLDQQRRTLLEAPSGGGQAEKRKIEVIEERLQRIDKEMAEVNARLPEIDAELADLQLRLDEANGVVRESEPVASSSTVDGASRWLDSKRRVQEGLVYLGGYNALIDGDFGPRTREAIRVYQGKQDVEQTGTLTDEQEAALLEEVDTLRSRYGMTTVDDLENGYRFSYPSALLTDEGPIEPNGRRYRSKDGEGELALTSFGLDGQSGTARLSALYETLLADYQVQYRRQRSDWFVVAGVIEEGRIIYDTARLNGDRVIRAQLSYPAEWRELWSPFAVILFNSFEALSSGES